MNYEEFIKELDIKLANYFELHKNFIHCKAGCSACCEKGDYPLTLIELEYLMKGYIALDNTTKQTVQQNIKTMTKEFIQENQKLFTLCSECHNAVHYMSDERFYNRYGRSRSEFIYKC